MLVYPSSMPVSNRALQVLADALRQRRTALGSRWRRLPRDGKRCWCWRTCARARPTPRWPAGSGSARQRCSATSAKASTSSPRVAPTLDQALDVARRKAFVILDGTLLSIDRVGMASGYDRAFFSGKHKRHGVNVQVIADPAGRLVWASPALPGARHDMGAAREHGIIDALNAAGVHTVADTAYQGGGPAIRVPQRRRRLRPGHRPLPAPVSRAEGGQRRPRPPARAR